MQACVKIVVAEDSKFSCKCS